MSSSLNASGAPQPPTLFALPKPKKNLPQVAHPKANVSSDPDLRVQGESKVTTLSMDAGLSQRRHFQANQPTYFAADLKPAKSHTKLDKSLPPLTQRSVGGRCRTGAPSPAEGPPPTGVATKQSKDRGKFRNTIDDSPQHSTTELLYLLHSKVASCLHGLKHMFKSHDSTGQGRISRTALQKILYNLLGYISQEETSKLLNSLGLLNKQMISFDDFVGCFREAEPEAVEWMSPCHQVILTQMRGSTPNLEQHLRQPCWWGIRQNVSAALLYSQLRMGARNREFSIQAVLPEECFQGKILPPQLKIMLDNLGHKMSGQEFNKLWNRFDTKQIGAVKLKTFLEHLGLDPDGEPTHFQRANTMMDFRRRKPKMQERAEQEIQVMANSPNECNEVAKSGEEKENIQKIPPKGEEPKKRVKKLVTRKPQVPRLDSIVDCLFYIFEEPYQAMLLGMQCFDFMADGHIARIDLQKVFAEFGLCISSMDLEYFLSRIGVRTIHGQINYQEFLLKFWNRSPMGMVSRIISNSLHPLYKNGHKTSEGETLSGSEMEAALVDFFHGKFFTLFNRLKSQDKHNLGVVPQYEFKDALENLLGYSMSSGQWESLKDSIGLDSDGLVPYVKFLESFNISQPGMWNKRDLVGQVVAKVRKIETPAPLHKLKQLAQEDINKHRKIMEEQERNKPKFTQNIDNMIKHITKPPKVEGRSIDELQGIVYDLFRTNFHQVDRAFKQQDRRMTGRFGKFQFGEILKSCSAYTTPVEIDRLWESLYLDKDGLVTFTSLVRFFVDYAQDKGLPSPTEVVMPRDHSLSAGANSEMLQQMDEDPEPFNGYYSHAYRRVPSLY